MRPTAHPPAHPWSPSEKLEVVMELLQHQDTLAGLAHQHGLSAQTLEAWRTQYLPEIIHPVPPPQPETEARLREEIQRLRATVAALQAGSRSRPAQGAQQL